MADLASDLIDLAAIVADGETPDWERASSHATGDRARSIVRHLRAIAEVGRLHATLSSTGGRGQRPHDRLEPGATWGPLQIVEHVGSGRFGDVYRAFDPSLHREVALKLLRERDGDADNDAFVVHEGRLAARVRHPNVVTVYGAQRIGDRTGVWMEFVVGRTLEAELAAEGPFDAGKLAHVATDLCGALAAVHEAGLVHRDVKASNVMRDAGGRVVLGDFGTGRELIEGDELRVGLAGTPAYIAPEIFLGAPATVQSDLYSFGALLFRLATGAMPVPGRSIAELRRAHASRPESLRSRRPDLPRAFTSSVDRALDPDPLRRFNSADAMAESIAVRPDGHRLAVVSAVLLGTSVAAALLVTQAGRNTVPPARAGISFEQLYPEMQRQARFRGPAVQGLVTCSKTGGAHIALCNLADGSIEVLRDSSGRKSFAPAGSSQLSPDGSRIAYVWIDSEGPRQPEAATLNVMSVAGRQNSVIHRVYPGGLQIGKWTSDGTAIAATESTKEDGTRLILVPADGRPMQLIRRLAPDEENPDLSPDGRTVVLAKRVERNNLDLVAIDVRTSEERWRLTDPANDTVPRWTPDGRGVVFVSDRLGGQSLMLASIGADSRPGTPIVLRDLGRSAIRPVAFGIDGDLYTLVTGPSRTSFIVPIDLQSGVVGTLRPLEPRAVEDSLGADWSPDGRRIAYLSGRAGDPNSAARLIVRDANGDGQQMFPLKGALPNFGVQARWAPDGRRILVSYFEKGVGKKGMALDLINPDTRHVQRLITDSSLEQPRWDSNGRGIYFRELGALNRFDLGTGKVTIVRPAGQPRPRLLPLGGFDVSRVDGSWLLVTPVSGDHASGERRCAVRRESPGDLPVEVPLDTGDCYSVLGLPDGKHVLAASQQSPDTGTLWLVNLETKKRTRLPLAATAIVDLSSSPDGRQLLFSAGNPPPEMWVVRLPSAK